MLFRSKRVADIAEQGKRRLRSEGIKVGSCRIRNQQHVGFLNLLEPADAGTIEPRALSQNILQLMNRLTRVLQCARYIHECEIHYRTLMLLRKIDYILRGFDLRQERKVLQSGFGMDGLDGGLDRGGGGEGGHGMEWKESVLRD